MAAVVGVVSTPAALTPREQAVFNARLELRALLSLEKAPESEQTTPIRIRTHVLVKALAAGLLVLLDEEQGRLMRERVQREEYNERLRLPGEASGR